MHLAFDGLGYQYPGDRTFSLNSISFNLDSSDISTLVGANGSGKSTIIKILIGQLLSFSGFYTIDTHAEVNVYGDLLHRYNIGYCPESVILDDELTGHEIITLVKDIRRITREVGDRHVSYLKQNLNIEDWFENKRCCDYSQGMRKKVALLLAFLGDMQYVILDEPTNGLDPLAIFGLKKILLDNKAKQKGAFLSSHILDFVEKIANTFLILKNGKVYFQGTTEDLRHTWSDLSLDEIYYTIFTTPPETKEIHAPT